MWNQLSEREKYLIYIAALAAVLFIFVKFVFWPQLSNYYSTRDELKVAGTRLENSLQLVAATGEARRVLQNLDEKYEAVQAFFVPGLPGGNVLVKLMELAGKNDVQVSFLQPGEPVKREHYAELPVQITVTGSYKNIIKYINLLETSRVIPGHREIKTVTIQPRPAGENLQDGTARASIMLHIYYSERDTGNAGAREKIE